MREQTNQPPSVFVESGVSAFTGAPFVHLRWGDMHGQWTPDEALQHAWAVIGAADAALVDAFLFKFAREKIGLTKEDAAKLLLAFRAYRGEQNPPADISESEQ